MLSSDLQSLGDAMRMGYGLHPIENVDTRTGDQRSAWIFGMHQDAGPECEAGRVM